MSVGRLSESNFLIFSSSGLIPPCMHNIFSSMTAATGMVLKVSMKCFHSLSENFRLPVLLSDYTRHRSRRACLSLLISDSLWVEKNSKDILSYSKTVMLLFRWIACRDPHNHLEKGNFSKVESLRNRISLINPEIAHGYLRLFWWALRVREALVVT